MPTTRARLTRPAALRRLAAEFRPAKKDRGEVVFLALPTPAELRRARAAHRPAPRYVRVTLASRRKALAVAVGARGEVKVLSTRGRPDHRPASHDLLRAAEADPGVRAAVDRAYAGQWLSEYRREGERAPRWAGGRLPPWNEGQLPMLTGRGRAGLSFDAIAKRVAHELGRVLRRRGRANHNLFVRWRCVTRDGAGEYREWFGVVKFQAGFQQELLPKALENFALLVLYASLAQQLAGADLVTIGSASRVRRLRANRGKARTKWKNARGETWEKNESEEVTIRNYEFDIDVLRLARTVKQKHS